MTLAVQAMDPGIQFVFFVIAVILFVIAAVLVRPAWWACLVALGLAFFVFVFAWNALAAT